MHMFMYKTVTIVYIVTISSFMYTNVMLWRYLETMGRGQELLKRTLVHGNLRKMQLGINTSLVMKCRLNVASIWIICGLNNPHNPD